MVKSIFFNQYKNGMFELGFNFQSRNFSKVYLVTDDCLMYEDYLGKSRRLKIPIEVYNGNDTRNFFKFESKNKDQMVFIFIPDSFFIEEQINPTEEESLTSLEVEYDSNFRVIGSWTS